MSVLTYYSQLWLSVRKTLRKRMLSVPKKFVLKTNGKVVLYNHCIPVVVIYKFVLSEMDRP